MTEITDSITQKFNDDSRMVQMLLLAKMTQIAFCCSEIQLSISKVEVELISNV